MSFLGGGGRSSQPSTPATQTQIVREAPGIEERKIELLDLARQVAQKPVAIPAERVAGLSALEQQATRLAGQTGVGAGTTAQGIAQLQAAAQAPNIQQFFNPFQSFVTGEILRQGQQMQNQLAGQAVRSGAFGGGREGVQQAELQARTLENIGRSQAQGFQTALGAAQNQQRTQAAVGQQLLGAGQQQQQMGQQDINQLMAAGGVQRQLAQAALDAQRRTQLQQSFEPFQRIGFLSNVYAQGPKTQSQIEMATAPTTNPLAQSVGAGLGAFQAFSGIQGA
tara:strand:+ start:3279 stop:4118 length:840 start_codon:yes stop_codon:yes gene_type:complete